MQMDDDQQHDIVSLSQGVHIVLDKKFFPGDHAMMIPKTDDGRVLFAVPWHEKVVVGTTDTPIEEALAEPKALEEEIEFILRHIDRYLTTKLTRNEIRSVYAGLRPLVKAPGQKNTSLTPRDHTIIVSKSGLVTITGGKWTTYRKMAKDAVDNAIFVAKLERKSCVTEDLKIHGWMENVDENDPLHFFGCDMEQIKKIWEEDSLTRERIHPDLPYTIAEIIWSVKNEMAMTVEDIMARRTRILFLDARAAIQSTTRVAQTMASVLNRDQDWINFQEEEFREIATRYLP